MSVRSGSRLSQSSSAIFQKELCFRRSSHSDSNKTIFDWCKEGDATQTEMLLREGGAGINDMDDEVNKARREQQGQAMPSQLLKQRNTSPRPCIARAVARDMTRAVDGAIDGAID